MARSSKPGGTWGWHHLLEWIDSAGQRRPRHAARQSLVTGVTVREGHIYAMVQAPHPGPGAGLDAGASVTLPCPDWWPPVLDEVAEWFCQRPDWLGALWMGRWEESFLRHAADAGRLLLPDAAAAARMAAGAECSCGAAERCLHVAGLAHSIAQDVQMQPERALFYVGVCPEGLFDRAHARTAERLADARDPRPAGLPGSEAGDAEPDAVAAGRAAGQDPLWRMAASWAQVPSVTPGEPPARAAAPFTVRWDAARLEALQRDYMAWVWGAS
ncbi:hypothetical protein [Alicyclobacillus macrosporangiidus]|uniref:Uncharacterized conserved protein, contains Zn finger domain n=1 Tax=Alicyclobacillus macrosporangiidus TaxID=392015 RepID=A0A1I7FM33_9BACL|nr:hypothetical protein [Alicyclobacillus macrosporangiidus]SFU37289.1 Uncharacterized conserved protein, contains Zn finger domain [Alicyclobacillus macrosporangiidus]